MNDDTTSDAHDDPSAARSFRERRRFTRNPNILTPDKQREDPRPRRFVQKDETVPYWLPKVKPSAHDPAPPDSQ